MLILQGLWQIEGLKHHLYHPWLQALQGKRKARKNLLADSFLHPGTRVSPLITGIDREGEGEQAKNNINVGAVSVTLGLKGNESDGKEILQIGGDREKDGPCWLKGKRIRCGR